ncbi:E1-like protein-activating enzyme Gsa7p/Apg7p [Spinellus fusiger]|nr:E1-like protein-activating enzyme Gsa7p/Apg7p [Spinellus fusiger]
MSSSILQFAPFSSAVDASFWQTLADKKLNLYQLSDASHTIQGYYTTGHSVTDHLGQSVAMSPHLCIPDQLMDSGESMDRQAIFQSITQKMELVMKSGEALKNPASLFQFFVVTFADLKKYKFYYWFCFPAPMPTLPWTLTQPVQPIISHYTKDQIRSLSQAYHTFRSQHGANAGYFIVRQNQENFALGTLDSFDQHQESEARFADPSGLDTLPGWPLRHLLALAHSTWKINTCKVICYRETTTGSAEESLFLHTSLPKQSQDIKWVGWERNANAKLSPRMADLGPLLDPARLANASVDLNLKLMRWRVMPDLDLERIKHTRCLLLGAGTLGCYVARCLLGWGVRHITFVDSGRVSFSNPVRQPLYTFQDCLEGGALKAEAAAHHLQLIQPSVTSKGYTFTIPMPGHPSSDQQLKNDSERLSELISEHDVVFLLTDSRESRWLPTLLGAHQKKLVINAALGFDSYLVMRHGVQPSSLGCYFCNDIVAPTDSLTDRTLDQQCTVTRPGLAAVAGALAVELMVSVLQHKDGKEAAADKSNPSLLGLVPHQIRGFLADFHHLLIEGQSYNRCTACSPTVLEHYQANPDKFLQSVLEDSLYLEKITGLTEMKAESEALLDDWAEEDDF